MLDGSDKTRRILMAGQIDRTAGAIASGLFQHMLVGARPKHVYLVESAGTHDGEFGLPATNEARQYMASFCHIDIAERQSQSLRQIVNLSVFSMIVCLEPEVRTELLGTGISSTVPVVMVREPGGIQRPSRNDLDDYRRYVKELWDALQKIIDTRL